jgi:hypothetical protein
MVMEPRSDPILAPSEVLDRAFYFIVVLWGERFRTYFLEYCVPSLLSTNNIPSLRTSRRNKFLIATRPEDWDAMSRAPIFGALSRYIDPVYIEIPPCPVGRSGCEHMNTGHKIACDMAFREKGLGVVITPDCMFSDGSMAHLQKLAQNGVQVVLTAALRLGEEPFLAKLGELGALLTESRSDSARPVTISGRVMVEAAVESFHTETLSYEWAAPYITPISPAAWWRVPAENGVLLHCMSWAPVLLDYGAVERHDMSTLDDWTIDGDYLFKNLGNTAKLHVIQDSDDLFLASWGPMGDRPFKPLALFQSRLGKWFAARLRAQQFRASFYSPIFDPLKRRIFFLPVRWHARELNEKWTTVEREARNELSQWVRPPDEDRRLGVSGTETFFRKLGEPFLNFGLALFRWLGTYLVHRRDIKRRLLQALRGDTFAIRRIIWNLRREVLVLRGRLPTDRPPQPNS